MTTTRKARYHQAIRYGYRILNMPTRQTSFPPSVTIAWAHRTAPQYFPLMSRRQWKKKPEYT